MKKFSEQFYTKASAVKLRAGEKRELRERVVSYMEYHPLPANLKSSAKETPLKSAKLPQISPSYFSYVSPFRAFMKYSLSTMAVLLVVVPYVADRALPGDALYAVKVSFNEEIKSTLTFGSYEKVEWETERLNRRIAEARLLASEGKLTEEVEAGVARAVRVHTANAQREIAVLRNEDADAATIASISFDATLEVQSSSLKNQIEQSSLAKADPSVTVNRVSLIASAIDESRVGREDTSASSSLPAYGKLVAKVEMNTTRIYELLEALKVVASPESLANAVRRSEDINRSFQEAVAKADSDEGLSRQQLVEVLQRTQRLIVFLTELEVIKTVDIETLIPVVLTEQENLTKKETLLAGLKKKNGQRDYILAEREDLDADVLAKVQASKEEIDAKLAELSTAEVDFGTFFAGMKGLHDLADEILLLLDKDIDFETAPVLEENSTTSEDVILDGAVSSSTVSGVLRVL